jgi:sterol desaturase/sphingolipid hydroxylase (fatty acid hydroxylase superfamily)
MATTLEQAAAAGPPPAAPAAKHKFHRGSARMFRSGFVEFFSHVHPATPAVLYLPLVGYGLYLTLGPLGARPAAALAWFAGGYLMWTLFEYWFHRLFFHVKVTGPRTERLYFFVHGVHHDYPWDRTRLVMPPAVSLSLAVIMYGLFRLVFGPNALWAPFAGFVFGYVVYDTVHWYTHAGKPRSRLGKLLRREHLVHHFREPTSRFGVSCPWWDHVFGTTGTPADVPGGAAQEPAR